MQGPPHAQVWGRPGTPTALLVGRGTLLHHSYEMRAIGLAGRNNVAQIGRPFFFFFFAKHAHTHTHTLSHLARSASSPHFLVYYLFIRYTALKRCIGPVFLECPARAPLERCRLYNTDDLALRCLHLLGLRFSLGADCTATAADRRRTYRGPANAVGDRSAPVTSFCSVYLYLFLSLSRSRATDGMIRKPQRASQRQRNPQEITRPSPEFLEVRRGDVRERDKVVFER